jgi:hypothetical protein
MRLRCQNNLIVAGNGSKKKLRGNNCGLQFRKQLRVALAQRLAMRDKKNVGQNDAHFPCAQSACSKQNYRERRPRTRVKPVPE